MIHHQVATEATLLKLNYEYVDNVDNPERIVNGQVDGRSPIWGVTETGEAGQIVTVCRGERPAPWRWS